MRVLLFFTIGALSFSLPTFATNSNTDSTAVLTDKLSEAVVSAVRVNQNAPFSVSNISRAELQDFSSFGQELPLLFARTPGVMAWSENGLGNGTTYMRIRGAADSRINVTLDGVPLNSPEHQCVFWANTNGYSALLGSVQIQRGVGTSTYGDGAFGGSISLSTRRPSTSKGGRINTSYGSCNTFNIGGSFSSGLFKKHFVAEGSFRQTTTDGYMNGTAGRSGSATVAISYLGDKFFVRYRNLANFEHTGQAWNGATAGNDDASLMDEGIKSYADMYAHGLGLYNSLYEQIVFDPETWSFSKDSEGNYMTERYRLSNGTYWNQTTDNFWQDHNIVSFSGQLSDCLRANATLYYTYGYGYYEEFRPNNKLSKFGLSDPSLKRTDFVRRKGPSQHSFGLLSNIAYKKGPYSVTAGLFLSGFRSHHFGYLTYIKDPSLAATYTPKGSFYKYYDSSSSKGDYSAFTKMVYNLTPNTFAYLDLQYRHVDFALSGLHDIFLEAPDGTLENMRLNTNSKHDFLNPKLGISYQLGQHKAYASIAISHREPERNNYTDNGSYPHPKDESVTDYEVGYQFVSGETLALSANFYYMDYHNQFVQTGAKSDIGENLTTNILHSFRTGIELSAVYKPWSWLSLEANGAFSQNKILDFTEIVEDWDKGEQSIHYSSSTLAYSPSALINGFVDFLSGPFKASIHTAFVSRMYLDNTQNAQRSLPAYSFTNIDLSYKHKFDGVVKEMIVACKLGNIFNAHFATSAWVYSAIYESGGYTNDNRYYQIGFMPNAGLTAMISVELVF